MKKSLSLILAFLLLAGVVHAATTVPLGKNQLTQYLLQVADSLVIGNTATTTYARLEVNGTTTALMFNATSTTASSSLPRLSTTGLSATFICLNGDTCRTTWPTGGSGLASSTPWTKGQLAVVASDSAMYSTATGTITGSTGLSVTAGQSVIGTGLTITNTGVTSVAGTYPVQFNASTGAVTGSLAFGTTTSNTWAGTQTFSTVSVSTQATIPYGASPTVSTNGDIGIDSTSNQFKYQSGSATRVLGNGNFYPSFTVSTSTAWTGSTTVALGTAFIAETWNAVQCFTDAGTLNVVFNDGTNNMNLFSGSTTVGTVALSSNNTFTASEKRYVTIGTPATSPTSISCSVSKSYTAD